MNSLIRRYSAIAASVLLAVTPQIASAQTWASWTSSISGNVIGTIGSTSVTYTGYFDSFDNSSAPGVGFWTNTNGTYSQNGTIAPTNPGLIRFYSAGRGTITFGTAVLDPYIAFNSVGQPGVPVTYDFGSSAFTVVSNNNTACAYWGCGSYTTAGNTITGREFSGVAKFNGSYSQLDFTFDAEGWHGITVGVGSTSTVPEPSTYVLMAAGLAGLAAVARRRRQA